MQSNLKQIAKTLGLLLTQLGTNVCVCRSHICIAMKHLRSKSVYEKEARQQEPAVNRALYRLVPGPRKMGSFQSAINDENANLKVYPKSDPDKKLLKEDND